LAKLKSSSMVAQYGGAGESVETNALGAVMDAADQRG